jgi:hypothetical protein|tara:strand:+ start:155 stop:415 length:261 start_codon:yes stop_codon:yes gene_type:complete
MGEFFSDYMSWSNFFYLVGIILAGYATAVTAKNRAIFIEIQELVETLERVNKDKKVTAEEKKEVMKEALDIAKAVIESKWAIWRSK